MGNLVDLRQFNRSNFGFDGFEMYCFWWLDFYQVVQVLYVSCSIVMQVAFEDQRCGNIVPYLFKLVSWQRQGLLKRVTVVRGFGVRYLFILTHLNLACSLISFRTQSLPRAYPFYFIQSAEATCESKLICLKTNKSGSYWRHIV